MGFLEKIFGDPKVPTDKLIELLQRCDANSDGYISLKEVKAIVKSYGHELKDSTKYLRG